MDCSQSMYKAPAVKITNTRKQLELKSVILGLWRWHDTGEYLIECRHQISDYSWKKLNRCRCVTRQYSRVVRARPLFITRWILVGLQGFADSASCKVFTFFIFLFIYLFMQAYWEHRRASICVCFDWTLVYNNQTNGRGGTNAFNTSLFLIKSADLAITGYSRSAGDV